MGLIAPLERDCNFALVSEVIAKEDVTRSYAQGTSMIVNSVFASGHLLALLFALVRGAIEENLRANWHVALCFVIFLYFRLNSYSGEPLLISKQSLKKVLSKPIELDK